ncbi:MAG: OadG-related small transporter subunit [Caldicoprobacter sp.]
MFENIAHASELTKSLFLMVVGLAGVYGTLALFYLMVKILMNAFKNHDA